MFTFARQRKITSSLETHSTQQSYTTKLSAMASDTMTFHLFLLLPVDIRFNIWEFAIPGSRIILILEKVIIDHNPWKTLNYLQSSCYIPAMLHIDRESREVAMAHYSLSLTFSTVPDDDINELRVEDVKDIGDLVIHGSLLTGSTPEL